MDFLFSFKFFIKGCKIDFNIKDRKALDLLSIDEDVELLATSTLRISKAPRGNIILHI